MLMLFCRQFGQLTMLSGQTSSLLLIVKDIASAISELDFYSATPDGHIPTKILCSNDDALTVPLWLPWNSSFHIAVKLLQHHKSNKLTEDFVGRARVILK